MTTTKTQPKTPPTMQHTEAPPPVSPELQAAYQIHTLAQMMYGQLAMARPWMAAVPPRASLDGPPAWNEQQAFMPPAFTPYSMPWQTPSPGMAPWTAPNPWVW